MGLKYTRFLLNKKWIPKEIDRPPKFVKIGLGISGLVELLLVRSNRLEDWWGVDNRMCVV